MQLSCKHKYIWISCDKAKVYDRDPLSDGNRRTVAPTTKRTTRKRSRPRAQLQGVWDDHDDGGCWWCGSFLFAISLILFQQNNSTKNRPFQPFHQGTRFNSRKKHYSLIRSISPVAFGATTPQDRGLPPMRAYSRLYSEPHYHKQYDCADFCTLGQDWQWILARVDPPPSCCLVLLGSLLLLLIIGGSLFVANIKAVNAASVCPRIARRRSLAPATVIPEFLGGEWNTMGRLPQVATAVLWHREEHQRTQPPPIIIILPTRQWHLPPAFPTNWAMFWRICFTPKSRQTLPTLLL